ncbi:SAF domain-containing protein [Cellulomonas sp. NS3]|uniref:SAF domain-containing protein n=1 Tax=Cellulomonas sp. NS3 TaxID=2973977 RepID=UPI002161DBB9|nr:SAF domain-containing protein [Cellulomonas sp. NS3]
MPLLRAAAPSRDRSPGRVPERGARTPARTAPRPLVRVRLLLWRARFPVAALLLGCACAVVVSAVRPAPPPTAPVLVLDRALAAGEHVAPDDVRTVRLPVDLVPDGSLHVADELPDATLAVPGIPGLPVVPSLFTQASVHGPPGTVVAPVRFADPGVAAMLTPGVVVDVLGGADDLDGTPGAGRVLARGALVLAGPADADAGGSSGTEPLGGGLLGGGGGDAEHSPLVLLAVTPEESVALTGSSGLSAVFVE